MQRGCHGSLGLARRVIPGGDFAAGLIKPGFHLVLQLQVIFKKVVNPRAEFLDLRAGQSRNGSFNFLNRTHWSQDNHLPDFCKDCVSSARQRIQDRRFWLEFTP